MTVACPRCGSAKLFGPAHIVLPSGEVVPYYDCCACHCIFATKEAS